MYKQQILSFIIALILFSSNLEGNISNQTLFDGPESPPFLGGVGKK